ncbi:MAG: DUF3576 domain-containing protein [Alphaproteobacteria bacterium]|nr:DUF3576 domain-containing protein [Alphaproteobacteria bacterium]
MASKARTTAVFAGLATVLALGACQGTETVYPKRNPGETAPTYSQERERDTIFGPGGINLFGGKKKDEDGGGGGGIGVNSFLWRASLDTIGFMPLASADPFGGVIITDWFAPPETPNERLKLTLYILDRNLRSDGIKVAVFRQVRGQGGAWVDAAVDPSAAMRLEESVLTRARQLRQAAIEK